MQAPKILYLVTEDWYFCANRLPLARAVRAAGAEIVVATRVRAHGDAIRRAGLRLAPLAWTRGGTNPIAELAAILEIARLYRRERPDLLHHIALKPAIHGALAARLAGLSVPAVTTLTGLGSIFIGSNRHSRLLEPVVRGAARRLLNRGEGRVILQNPDDRDLLVRDGVLEAGRATVIRGDGVDLQRFVPSEEPAGRPIAAFVGRMLHDKGVEDFVGAARRLRERHVPIRLLLVGAPDPENPASISESTLTSWQREGLIEWRGPVSDIAETWAKAHIAVLPSYREGLPNALLEAAACGRPLVATDVPGCREVVRPNETGLRVPAGDPTALADALERLAGDAPLRQRLGAGARRVVEAEFAEPLILRQVLDLYRTLLPGRLDPPPAASV